MSASTQIRDLVHAKLVGRKIDVVAFIDGLLEIASTAGDIRCCLANDHGLRFELGDQGVCEVELDLARSKLRMMCARLSVLCNETPGAAVSPYGGEGVLRATSQNGTGVTQLQWTVQFKNTPGEHEFTVTPAKVVAIVEPMLKKA